MIKKYSLSLTLFLLVATVFILAPAVSATSYVSGGVSRRREHANLKRFVKKRALLPLPSSTTVPNSDSNLAGALIGAGLDPTDIIGNSTSTSTSSVSTETATNSSTTSQTETSTTATTTANATISSTSSSSTTSSTTSETSKTSSSSTTSSETQALPSSIQVTVTQTSTSVDSQQTAQNNVSAPSSTLSSASRTTLITVLIVVAASVGGLAVLWTVFRKWKLSRSSKFDQRLQPISWEPTVDDDVVPRRPGSDSASIHSAQERSTYGANSNLSHGLDHDFTAGPAHLAPVGGYADLTRGPSPQPSMQETLSRGPSLTRSNYDASVPLHHQNNYGVQDGYGRY